jgi:hypothetical protein
LSTVHQLASVSSAEAGRVLEAAGECQASGTGTSGSR